MGLFGGSKTYVSSVLYNLAGDPLERPNFLKTAIIGQVIFPTRQGMGENLRNNYLKGPGIRLRSFFRWSLENYGPIGVPQGTLGGSMNFDRSIIAGEIPADPGMEVLVQVAEAGIGDYSYWAEQYMFENHIDLIETAWTSDINETTGDITITFVDTTTVTFTPVGFDKTKAYLYVVYSLAAPPSEDAPEVGADDVLGSSAEFTSTVGWTLLTDTLVPEAPNERRTKVYEKTEYMGQDPDPETDILYSIKSTMTQETLFDPADVEIGWVEQLTTQRLIHQEYGFAKMFIYELGSGNVTLDAIVADDIDDGEYVPFIPLRLDNQFLSTSNPELYALTKKAYKKATGGGKIEKLIEQIADNEKLSDIDYAYVMYGVSLNILDPGGREYIYRFFDKLRMQSVGDNIEYLLWKSTRTDEEAANVTYEEWKVAQSNELDPLYNTASPPRGWTSGTKPANSNRIKSSGTGGLNMNVDMTITWDSITRETGVGLAKPGAKTGEYWVQVGTTETVITDTVQTGKTSIFLTIARNAANSIVIYHQIDADNWEALEVVGAKHINNIYNNKSVDITAIEAIQDADESGFLLPLHYGTYREMSLKSSTQLSTVCAYIVFNSYQVVKLKWYQTGIFKIIVFIIVIVITIYFPPGGGAAGGILGSSAAVGAALGLTGTLALIAGAVANALAMMLLMKIVSIGATAIFGEKFGAIITAIVALVTMTVGPGLLNGQSLSAAWGGMMSAQSLIQLSMSVGNGIAGYMQASANEIYQDTQQMVKDYNKESLGIMSKFINEFGMGASLINPLGFTEAFNQGSESMQSFLDRTLMTGSDIAELSHDMLNNFTEYTLSLDPAGR